MKENKKYAFVLLGKPGSGKGVSAKIIQEILWQNHSLSTLIVSTGDQYRLTAVNKNHTIKINDFNRAILQNQSIGKIQNPVNSTAMWVAKIWADWKGEDSIIMEGSPRAVMEMYNLESFILHHCRMAIVYLEIYVKDETAIKNMNHRHELQPRDETSNSSAINYRIEEYYVETAPIIGVVAKNSKHFYRLENEERVLDLKNRLKIILSNLLT